MASRDLDILVRAKGALQAARDIGKVDSSVGRLGGAAGRIGKIGLAGIGAGVGVAAAVIGKNVTSGLQSLADLESATTSVDGAIKQMGLTGQLTSAQVADWANQIEASIHGAFDDAAITQAATTLLRFGKVAPANLRPALQIVADLATKTGDVSSASTLLAKALADPAKAAGRLSRAGVILTKAQQDQIKAFMKAGETGKAQALVLDAVAKATTGAADASQGKYAKSLSVLHDTVRDAQRALAEGFLPVIEKVRDVLSKELAKPQTLANLREFGKNLASGLGHLIDIAMGLPWGAIGDALKLGGAGAKIILDAFMSMPPWVQTAIATGWGLNKLTGGAVTGIIGSLASGLIKGVLGINAGVVNIKAGAVVGGAGGGVPGAPGAAGGIGLLGKVFLIGEAIGLVAAVVGVQQEIAAGNTQLGHSIHDTLTNSLKTPQSAEDLNIKLAGIDEALRKFGANPALVLVAGDSLKELMAMRVEVVAAIDAQKNALNKPMQIDPRGLSEGNKELVDRVSSSRDAIETSRIALVSQLSSDRASAVSGTQAIVTAIHGIQFPKTIQVSFGSGHGDRQSTGLLTKGGTTLNKAGGALAGAGHHN